MNNGSVVNKRNIFFAAVVIVAASVVISVFSYINSQQTVVVRYKNISKVTIQKLSQGSKSLEKETIYKKSGEKIKISKGHYLLKYTGSEGYASDYENINVGDKPVSIYLDPSYSDQKLSGMLNSDFESIKTFLNTKYQKMSDYIIQKGKLYKKGQWYGTTLQYNGVDLFNYDTLRLVMKKQDGVWQVVTNPPNIVLASKDYPDVPLDILRDINNVQNTPFAQKYTDPNGKVYFP